MIADALILVAALVLMVAGLGLLWSVTTDAWAQWRKDE